MTLALALVFGAYVAFVLGACAVLARQARPPLLADDDLPEAVVVVAARDEEDAIGRCLAALHAQDYPPEKLTVVVADDHSADGTAAVVREAMGWAGGPEVRYLRVSDPEDHLRGKAQALHEAIAATASPVVLLTDADCAPVPTWARAMATALAEDGVGVACGMSRVAPRPGRFFDRVQAADWALLLGLMGAAAEAGAPAGGMGNDMALRREAYAAVGGYPALPFSVTEDFLLIQAVVAAGWAVRFPVDGRSAVWTLPVEGPRAVFEQRRRWARGGLSGDPWVLAIYVLAFAVHALLVAGLVVTPAAGLAAFGARAAADLFGLATIRRRLGGRAEVLPSVAATAFMVGYLVVLPFVLALRPEIGWKGRRH